MTDKHTPGPWATDDIQKGDKIRYVFSDDGWTVCRIPLDCRESEANARLIAKAPELHALALRIARLNRDAGEIGAGMLASLVDEARRLTE